VDVVKKHIFFAAVVFVSVFGSSIWVWAQESGRLVQASVSSVPAVEAHPSLPDNTVDERLVYEVGWSGIPAAHAEWNAHMERDEGSPRLAVRTRAETYPYVSIFWEMRDEAEAWMDGGSNRPLRFELKRRENALRSKTRFDFDHDENALSIVRDEKESGNRKVENLTLDLVGQYDPISAAMALRNLPLEEGTPAEVLVYTGDNLYRLTFSIIGREQVTVPAGTFEALVVQPEVFNLDKNGPNKKLKSAKIWVTDDARRILLKIKSEVFIGWVYAELTEMS